MFETIFKALNSLYNLVSDFFQYRCKRCGVRRTMSINTQPQFQQMWWIAEYVNVLISDLCTMWLAQLSIPSFRPDTAFLKLSYFLVVFLPTLLDRSLPLHIKHVVEWDVGVLADCGGWDVGVWGGPSSLIRFLGELAVCEHRKWYAMRVRNSVSF